ncbi:MAG: hypothetical protein ACOXZV_05865 [Bacteroidales bacterium]
MEQSLVDSGMVCNILHPCSVHALSPRACITGRPFVLSGAGSSTGASSCPERKRLIRIVVREKSTFFI